MTLTPKSKTALAILLLFYLIIALAHASFAPLTTGPDELAHYEYLNFIATHGRLPLNNEEREQASYKSDQPPLYHLIATLPAMLVDPTGPPFLKRVRDHDRRQLIERTRHAWGLYNTEDEQWPYRGEILRWHVGRWVAIFFGMATLIVTFFLACDIFAQTLPHTNQITLALITTAIIGLIPRFALTGSMLNYETTQTFLATILLWILLRPDRFPKPVRSIELGFFAGLAITAKLSAIILPVEIVIALWLIARHNGWSWQQWARQV
jgi:4-amino-4-deoxy-L-arabinose transferase-like glycosyltransferase